jgi:hypothetical protein
VPRCRLRARDGSELRWGESEAPWPGSVVPFGAPFPVTVAVSPVRQGHAVVVEYRVDGGPVRQVNAVPGPRAGNTNARTFRATLPGQRSGLVEFVPVLRFAGQPISPRLGKLAEPPSYQVRNATAPIEREKSMPQSVATPGHPRWTWGTKFLGTLTATLRKELVGATPDGLRIDWHVEDGSLVGPGLEAIVLPGGTDWMRVRSDGVGIINVTACIETRTGARIFTSYGGIFDLGPNGYERALRDEFDPLPPLVVAPTYVTSDENLKWLNRAQCIGVGKVDMLTRRIEFDIYIVQVGQRKACGASSGPVR